MRVVIAGGGTAGHVNPGIALADALHGDSVTFIGTPRGAEASLVPEAGYPLEMVDVVGFDRARPATIASVGGKAARAVLAARGVLQRLEPDVVVGMGGYVSLPACVAARSLGAPVLLHEQNIVLGLANRVCKPLARVVAVSFEETLPSAGRRGALVGNPVRAEFTGADLEAERRRALARFELDRARKTLLVFGGSQGAQRVNEAAIGLAALWARANDRQVLHIAGAAHTRKLAERVAPRPEEGLIYRVVEFVDRMVEAYAVADLALCRGGATTVAELGSVGLPSIIVPYPYHRDRQQERHGRALERAGAAVVVLDAEATPERVGTEVERLFSDASSLQAMAKAALSFGRPDAAEKLSSLVRAAA